MHVRPAKQKRSSFEFKLGEETINYCSKYKYLGTYLNEFLNYNKMISELHDSASRALGAIICKMKKCGGFPLNTEYKLLVDSRVYSITDFCTEVIGYNHLPANDAIHLRTLRSFLGVKKTAPNCGVKSEMRWLEPRSRAHIRMVRHFLRIRRLPDTRLTKRILLADTNTSQFGTVDCWSTEIFNILNSHGLGHFFTNLGDDKYIIKSLTDSLLQTDIANYQNSCLSSPKLRTCVNIVDFSQENLYLYKPLSFYQKSNLAKFRLGTLPLEIEIGRFCRPMIPETERICTQCQQNTVESEMHFTLHCKKHEMLRFLLFNRIGWPDSQMTDFEIIRVLSSDTKLVKIFSQYIGDCLDNRLV